MIDESLEIVGAGFFLFDWLFGGGGSSTPTSVEASLRSKSLINLLFLLSEGEIAGFPVGDNILKYIYANNTPVMNPDGTVNFLGVVAEWRSGTQSGSKAGGKNGSGSIVPVTTPGAETPYSVNQQIFKSYGPVVRSIVNSLATSIRITLYCPSLQRSDKEGIIFYSKVEFKIYVSSNGGSFMLAVSDSFEGRTAGGYARDYTIDVSGLPAPWAIKVERVSDDIPPTNTLEQNSLYWQTYTTILQDQFVYPNSALLYVAIDTTYFNAQPTISVLFKGLICTIPSNYNPTTRTYVGIWDGTFTRAYSNNPAWCLLMLLTNPIYGCGQYISLAQVDKWSLYTIAQYCDELVSDGYGGSEPRYSYNHYMTQRAEAFTQINTILSQIRGIAYYAGGQIYFAIDSPNQKPVALFNDSDTVREYDENGHLSQPPFTYDYVSLKQKHSSARVSWYDQNQFGKKRIEYLDLYDIGYGDDFVRYGAESIDVDLSGCISQAEARRHGRWLLATGRLESKTVLFATGDEGMVRKPSDLIQLFDAHEQGARYGGRVLVSTTTQIVLDAEVTIAGGDAFVVMVDGLELSSAVGNPPGVYTQITLATPLSTAPPAGSVWGIIGAAQPEIYRIISVGNPSPNKYTIAAIASNPIKYALADGTDRLVAIPGQTLPNPPTNIVVQVITGGYLVGWMASTSTNVTRYYLEYAINGSNDWTQISTTNGVTSISVTLPRNIYVFKVRSIDIYGQYSTSIVSAPAYPTSGIIAANSLTGTATLDRQVNLAAGTTYYLQTNCVNRPGYSTSQVSPYVDRRKITSAAGITNELTVSPDYRGQSTNLTTRSTPLTLDYIPAYLVVGGGDLTIISGGIYTIPPGNYVLTPAQISTLLAATSFTVAGTAVLWQYPPAQNPILGSQWSISTQPLEQIGNITANGGLLTI